MRLFHYSEEPGIQEFRPRQSTSKNAEIDGEVVWAVAEEKCWKLLLPRDCPRVAFEANASSSSGDVDIFLSGEADKKVLAIESAWLDRCLKAKLYRYEFDSTNFLLHDSIAGHYTSRSTEVPIETKEIENLLIELTRNNIELRVSPSLWDIREKVYRSSLDWSFIRMRNAKVPLQGMKSYLPV